MTHQITIANTDHHWSAEPNQSLLDAALVSGIPLPHECRSGGCGTCRVRIVSGEVRYPDDEMPFGIDEAEVAAGFALACQAMPVSTVVLAAPDGLLSPASVQCAEGQVMWVREVAPDVFHLVLNLDDEVTFRPGQYANILCADGVRRSFSMASTPRRQEIDFYIRRLDGGLFTDRLLPRLRQGDRLPLEVPHGTFRLHAEDYQPLLLLATGTGIAPIRAMLESLLDNPDCPPVSLYWGMRTQADLFLDDEIRSWAGRLYDFTYVPVLSRPLDGWSGRTGHVQQAVATDFDDLSEHAVYLCGSPQMLRDARGVVSRLGASVDHIHAEGFTLQTDTARAG